VTAAQKVQIDVNLNATIEFTKREWTTLLRIAEAELKDDGIDGEIDGYSDPTAYALYRIENDLEGMELDLPALLDGFAERGWVVVAEKASVI
jgi:hypothetical protein